MIVLLKKLPDEIHSFTFNDGRYFINGYDFGKTIAKFEYKAVHGFVELKVQTITVNGIEKTLVKRYKLNKRHKRLEALKNVRQRELADELFGESENTESNSG